MNTYEIYANVNNQGEPAVVLALAGGHGLIVDEADLQLVTRYSWQAKPGARVVYATHRFREGGKYRTLYLHRYLMGAQSGQIIDHINGNGLDNRRRNLRFCTNSENARNGRIRRQFKGVYPRSGKFFAKIQERHLGTFETEAEAAHAFDRAARERYGDFARPNFPFSGDAA